MSRASYGAAIFSGVLLAELGISTEGAATFAFTAALICVVVFALRRADRPRILAVAGRTVLACLFVAAALSSPLLVSYFASHPPSHVWRLPAYEADLVGPIMPTPGARRAMLDGHTFYTDWQRAASAGSPGSAHAATRSSVVVYSTHRASRLGVYGRRRRARGWWEVFLLRSAALGGRTRPVYVYLPAVYGTDRAGRFAVVYLLHGMPGSGWGAFHAAFRVDVVLDRLVAAGRIRPLIAVVVSGSTGYLDRATEWANGPSRNAQWDTYLARDVVGAVDRRYRTVRTAAGRAVVGYSAGADGAINQLILHRTFGVAGVLSSDFVQTPASVGYNAVLMRRYSAFATLPGALARLARQHVAVFMTAGSDDQAFHAELWAARLFTAFHIPYRLLVISHRGHSWRVWKAAFEPCLIYIAHHLSGPAMRP